MVKLNLADISNIKNITIVTSYSGQVDSWDIKTLQIRIGYFAFSMPSFRVAKYDIMNG